MSGYTPIDCELYSNFELAIIRRQRLRIAWRTSDGTFHLTTLLPCDLQTRKHAEYLVARNNDGTTRELRLDRIIRVEPLSLS